MSYINQYRVLKPNSNFTWSKVEVLKLAAGVESNTLHPIGKAIVEAARAANCWNVTSTKEHTEC
ncbi:hypothetical protein CsSME_00010027 [Camellia sinensis var. sinensis]